MENVQTTQLNCEIPAALHKRVKLRATSEDTTLHELVAKYLHDGLERDGDLALRDAPSSAPAEQHVRTLQERTLVSYRKQRKRKAPGAA